MHNLLRVGNLNPFFLESGEDPVAQFMLHPVLVHKLSDLAKKA